MKTFPKAKINIGLSIGKARKEDLYHPLCSIFYPINLADELEIKIHQPYFDCVSDFKDIFTLEGLKLDGNPSENLVIRAINLLRKDFSLPYFDIRLKKNIPTQAGLGGGSSDAAYAIQMINNLCNLQLDKEQMMSYALKIGADCPFFIQNNALLVQGIGEIFSPLEENPFTKKYIVVIKPQLSISTKTAYQQLDLRKHVSLASSLNDLKKNNFRNDFENVIFDVYPDLKSIKEKLLKQGAFYASLSGSGSSIFALYHNREEWESICAEDFESMFLWKGQLQ